MLGSAATAPLTVQESTPHEAVDAARYALAARLLDSLLHDVRNPLNALSINLEVLSEKLKIQAGGAVPLAQEKNLKAMREQIQRVDQILRLFSPYIAQSPAVGEVQLSQMVTQALDVLGHESRRARVRFRPSVEPDLRLAQADTAAVRFLISTLVLHGLERCAPGGELLIELFRQKGKAVMGVQAQGETAELSVPLVLAQAAACVGGEVTPTAGGYRVELAIL